MYVAYVVIYNACKCCAKINPFSLSILYLFLYSFFSSFSTYSFPHYFFLYSSSYSLIADAFFLSCFHYSIFIQQYILTYFSSLTYSFLSHFFLLCLFLHSFLDCLLFLYPLLLPSSICFSVLPCTIPLVLYYF